MIYSIYKLSMLTGISIAVLTAVACSRSSSISPVRESNTLPEGIWVQVEPYINKGSQEDDMKSHAKDTYSNDIVVQIGGKQFIIEPYEDSRAFSELRDMLIEDGEISLKCSNYGGFEKVCELGFSLSTEDSSITTQSGDVMLYQGDKLVFFYDSNTWDYTKIGRINADKEELEAAFGGEDTEAVLFADLLEY